MSNVAVVIAAYNAEATIVAAVESILAGSMPCSVFIVDDHSTTPVEDCLRHLADRVEITRLDVNIGAAGARNFAIAKIIDAGFKYVAIMDADDISYPLRIEKQFDFLEKHPQVGACGTWERIFDPVTNETLRISIHPTDPPDVRNAMFFNMGVGHSSAMIRCDVLKNVGLYSVKYPVAEDYELMRRIAAQYDLANMPECLVHYRVSPEGASQSRRHRQLYDRLLIQIKYFKYGNWRAWAGILKTLSLILIPAHVVQRVRATQVKLATFQYNSRHSAQN